MKHPKDLSIQDFTYALPPERIARYPLQERDSSKLLVYKDGQISEDIFRNIAQQLPQDALVVFNQTKVVHARLIFQKATGGRIEIFCLEADARYPDVTTAFAQKGEVYWQCMVGGAAKWKEGTALTLTAGSLMVTAEVSNKTSDGWIIHFRWNGGGLTFAEVLHAAGKVPLPPYLNREASEGDEQNYQTIFASKEGSVAAPTASLHFTEQVMKDLEERGIRKSMLTLHVGAGTFLPIKAETIGGHSMHSEWIEVEADTIEELLAAKGPIIAAGTTALRTLESLYWIGAKVHKNPLIEDLSVKQWEPYEATETLSRKEALKTLLLWMNARGFPRLITRTGILIAPGYDFRIVEGLITNFHQPQSTLLLLVAALIGGDWREVYRYAMDNNFRFLSYGDSSLLWRQHQ